MLIKEKLIKDIYLNLCGDLMGKIREHEYPEIGLKEAVEYVTPIVKKYGGKISRKGFEKEIDKHGGWLSKIVNSLKGYGLIDGRGIYRATDLTQTIVLSPIESEREKALGKICLNYEILGMMHKEFKDNVPEKEAVSVFLKEKLGADWSEARKSAPTLLNLYKEAFSYIKSVKEEVAPPEPTPPPSEIEEIRFGDIYVRLPKENLQEAWKKTKRMIDIYLGMKPEETSEEEG